MKYHNGQLHNEQDITLCLKPYSPKNELCWQEYVPFAVLGALLLGLLIDEVF